MLIGLLATCTVAWPQLLSSEASFDVEVDVQPVARIAISGPSTLDLTIGPPSVAGEQPPAATSDGTYVQYTSTVATGGHRVLQAQVLGSLLAGAKLELQAVPPTSGGAGALGSSLGYRTLSASATTVIESIGACTSGNANPTSGGRLYYRLSADSIAQLRAVATSITVQLTLTDAP